MSTFINIYIYIISLMCRLNIKQTSTCRYRFPYGFVFWRGGQKTLESSIAERSTNSTTWALVQ